MRIHDQAHRCGALEGDSLARCGHNVRCSYVTGNVWKTFLAAFKGTASCLEAGEKVYDPQEIPNACGSQAWQSVLSLPAGCFWHFSISQILAIALLTVL